MRLLINENIPRTAIAALRAAGYDLAAIAEDSPGITDEDVLSRAHAEQRIIVPFDRDYGELIYRYRLPRPAGVIYVRFVPVTPDEPAPQIIELIDAGEINLLGMFTVVDRDHLRQRPLA